MPLAFFLAQGFVDLLLGLVLAPFAEIVAVTAEPLPSRLVSLVLGPGDLNCVYHFALPELRIAVAGTGSAGDKELLKVASAAPMTRVHCYAGARYPERPTAFEWEGRRLAVVETLRQWRSPTGLSFDVLADDGQRYWLSWTERDDSWSISPARAA